MFRRGCGFGGDQEENVSFSHRLQDGFGLRLLRLLREGVLPSLLHQKAKVEAFRISIRRFVDF